MSSLPAEATSILGTSYLGTESVGAGDPIERRNRANRIVPFP